MPGAPACLVSTASPHRLEQRREQLDALGCAVLPRPFHLDDLLALVRRLTEGAVKKLHERG